jgi:hypothetical protein
VDAVQLFRGAFKDLHDELGSTLAETADEDVWWRPNEEMNSVGFLYWHLVRDEDTVINAGIGHGQTLWETTGWAEGTGLGTWQQGTGMQLEEAAGVRYDRQAFDRYAESVWTATDGTLAGLTPEGLDRDVPMGPDLPATSVGNLIATGVLAHGWVHLGEIRYVKGLRGWRYRE